MYKTMKYILEQQYNTANIQRTVINKKHWEDEAPKDAAQGRFLYVSRGKGILKFGIIY